MEYTEFLELAKTCDIVPVYESIAADLLTPVLAYARLRRPGQFSFLLESVEGIGRFARYSFLGLQPDKIIQATGKTLHISEHGSKREATGSLFEYLRREMAGFQTPRLENLPAFTGGIVGYLGYETVALIEDVLSFKNEHELQTPDAIFGLFHTILAFDHYNHQLILIHNLRIDRQTDLREQYDQARLKLTRLRRELAGATHFERRFSAETEAPVDDRAEAFYKKVRSAKQNILDGDIFQIVLSRRFSAGYSGDLLNVYRALRMINPSPYMYFMEFDSGFTVIGTSPEDLLRVRGRTATILPIAGTRKRGQSAQRDKELELDLLNDPKEIAEHIMLVDLARNDLGRVSKTGTVQVVANMEVHRYSHVMHLVSRVEGELAADKDCIDALMAAFPAGTLTGAPKIRAMELIEESETVRRNVYGGAVGYIDFSGNLDMCIAIRTLFAKDGKIHWQAGAGIVADSQPEAEYKEINNKAAVLQQALEYAGVINEDFSDR